MHRAHPRDADGGCVHREQGCGTAPDRVRLWYDDERTAHRRHDQRARARARDCEREAVSRGALRAPFTARWQLPQPPVRDPGVTPAVRQPPPCAQQGAAPGAGATSSVTEDCLFLECHDAEAVARLRGCR